MKNPRSTGPPQLEANPLQRLLSVANSLQLDNGNGRRGQTGELRAGEVNSGELSPRAPRSEAPEEGAPNSLQLDSGNSRPAQAAELRVEEVSSAELSPGTPNSEAPAKGLRAPELISALLSPPAISSELGATSLSRVSLPAAVCQLASDSLLAAKVSDDSADEGTLRLLNQALQSPPPKISWNALNMLDASRARS